MSVLGITKATFEHYVPMGIEPTGEVWRKVSEGLHTAYNRLKCRVGGDVSDDRLLALRELPPLSLGRRDMPRWEEFARWIELPKMVERYVCLEAFAQRVAANDVVLTSAGFGVVSTQNVAPASAHRVQALREELRQAVGEAYDDVVECLIASPNDTPLGERWRMQLVPTARVARRIGVRLPSGGWPYGMEIDHIVSELWEAQCAVEREFGSQWVRNIAHTHPLNDAPGTELLWPLRLAVADYIRAGGEGVQWRDTCWTRLNHYRARWGVQLDHTPYAQCLRQAPDLSGKPEGNAFFFGG